MTKKKCPPLGITLKDWVWDQNFRTQVTHNYSVMSWWVKRHKIAEGEGVLFTNKAFTLCAIIFVWGGIPWMIRSATHESYDLKRKLLMLCLEALVKLQKHGKATVQFEDFFGDDFVTRAA